jgi:Flp pilus assembly protein TadB
VVTSFRAPISLRRRERSPIHQITGARPGVRDDVNSRTRRYLISMGVRTVCFLLAVVTAGWLRWVMIAAAVVLPYLSVVFANSGRERIEAFPGVAATTPKAIEGPASRDS